jgi:hypothetical protein
MPARKKKMSNSEARQQALEVRDGFALEPTSLISYRSSGKLIALGDAETLKQCDQLPPTLEINRIECESGQVQLEGYLGAYTVTVTDAHGNAVTHRGDAVIDLNPRPLITREMPPPGYFHAITTRRFAPTGYTVKLSARSASMPVRQKQFTVLANASR